MTLGSNLLRYNDDQEYLVFDKESEDLNLFRTRPWQCAFLIAKGNKIIEEFDLYPFWPDLRMSEGAAAVTQFNHGEYKKKSMPAKEAYDIFNSYFRNSRYKIIGHNIFGFDSMVEANWRRELGLEPDYSWMLRAIDSMAIAKAIKKGVQPDISSPNAFLSWQLKMASLVEKGLKTNLALLGKQNKIEFDYENLHKGNMDIKLNLLVWNKLKWQIEI